MKLELLNEIREKVQLENRSASDFQQVLSQINRAYEELLLLLEEAYENNKNDEYKALLFSLKKHKANELIEKLKKYGYSLKNNIYVKESFEKMGYRFLEQTRYAKREEIFHGFLRIFMISKENFPLFLTEIFKPYYSDELFAIFVYSFLSGVIGTE